MSDLKYTYALDSTKTFLVLINNTRKDKEYFCPNSKCDERLIIKDVGYKRKYFSHTRKKFLYRKDYYCRTHRVVISRNIEIIRQ